MTAILNIYPQYSQNTRQETNDILNGKGLVTAIHSLLKYISISDAYK